MMKVTDFKGLEVFESPFGGGLGNLVTIHMPEFTCLCPKTGQPDFGKLELNYLPKHKCVELKSLKLYLWTFRDRGVYHEAVTHEMAETLFVRMNPLWLRFTSRFFVRGGLYTTVIAERGDVAHRDAHFKMLPDTSRGSSESYR
jgi:7-cyano-7-deazaguanine reductase